MTSYVQKGETLDYINKTGKDIHWGDVVSLKNRIAIAASNIPINKIGSINVTGVFKFNKASVQIEMGDDVYYVDDVVTNVKSDNAIPIGYAVSNADVSSKFIDVKLLG